MTCMIELAQFASIRRNWVRRMVNSRHAKLCVIALMVAFLTPTRADGADGWIGETIEARYEELLLMDATDYDNSPIYRELYENSLADAFEEAIRDAREYPYARRDQIAYFDFKVFPESDVPPEIRTQFLDNERFAKLFTKTLPMLAYAYRVPGSGRQANPYYHNEDVLDLFLFVLEYCYGRGLTEDAWLPDHAATASKKALARGLVRPSGDLSAQSLQLGGFVQSIFLMREQLRKRGLLDRYRKVLRNLAINNGHLYPVFFEQARPDAGADYSTEISDDEAYYLNADGIRLFVDYFMPYFVLIKDAGEQRVMAENLRRVIAKNLSIVPGSQGTIKPDGTGFHHHTAYVGGYTPYTFEAHAQLLYLVSGSDYYAPQNVEVVKFALESFRTMAQKYTVSSALKGRLIRSTERGAAIAILKSMALLAHFNGIDDAEMRARFHEYFDRQFFFESDRLGSFYQGERSVKIRGLGIFRIIDDVLSVPTAPAAVPSGVTVKPYAAAAFFRRDNWLVTAKGFSRYFWDYEGPMNKHQNSFGQNWSYGLLQVFSAGDPVSERESGYDLWAGWDWYHVPGTTASHYPVVERTLREVTQRRKELGVKQTAVQRNYSDRSFVGGVSNGDHGLFVVDLQAVPFTDPTNLTARKSYFFVGDKVLALGTRITGGTELHETHTTLFQTKLQSSTQATRADGQSFSEIGHELNLTADKPTVLRDSVGNSYVLVKSSAELAVTRNKQSSLSTSYEPTSGHYVQAFLNHGLMPEGDHYEYVLIPADPDGQKADALASDVSSYYQVIHDDLMHIVRFPEYDVTGYAFYETGLTPGSLLVKSSNLNAVAMTQRNGDKFYLAVSVPDIGWHYDPDDLFAGLGYGSRHYATQEAKLHELQLVLRGRWRLSSEQDQVGVNYSGDETILHIKCQDGLSQQLILAPAKD